MAFLDPESQQPFDEALALFLADWTGLEDTDEIVAALREAADDLEKGDVS